MLLLLVTPGHINILENDDKYIPNLVRQAAASSSHITEVDVVAAVVDHISFPKKSSSQTLPPEAHSLQYYKRRNGHKSDGVSFFLLDSNVEAPNLWSSLDKPLNQEIPIVQAPNTISFTMQSILQVPRVLNAEPLQNVSRTIQLPLARTLFLNGSHCTVRAQRWSVDRSGPHVNTTKARDIQMYSFSATLNHFLRQNSIVMPSLSHGNLQNLTPNRVIAAAVGNVVREFEMGSYSPRTMPASEELENIMNKSLASSTSQKALRDVWALVTPKEHCSSLPEVRHVGLDESFRRGSRLHKVLGGGGGWGSKQGLLALDPDSGFLSTNLSQTEDETNASADPQTIFSVRDVVKPGDTISFLSEQEGPEKNQSHNVHDASFCIDANASISLGGLPLANSNEAASMRDSTHEHSTSQCITIRNHFGMLSDQGISMRIDTSREHDTLPSRANPVGEVTSTKLDIPYVRIDFCTRSYFSFRFSRDMESEQTASSDGDPALGSDDGDRNQLPSNNLGGETLHAAISKKAASNSKESTLLKETTEQRARPQKQVSPGRELGRVRVSSFLQKIYSEGKTPKPDTKPLRFIRRIVG